MDKLKPCPFCGGSDLFYTYEINDLGDRIPTIFCNSCKAIFRAENDSPYYSEKETFDYLKKKNIEAWNRRVGEE